LAYYESSELYPDVQDCDGQKLYGALTGTPIRHHKIIDGNSFPHMTRDYDKGHILPISLEFNIQSFITNLTTTYPDLVSDIICWEIVQAERTEDNKTILDKGITTFREASQYYYGSTLDKRSFIQSSNETIHGANNSTLLNTDTVRFYSPKTLLKKNLNPSYYKVENASLFQN
jgi:hypothetical protein